MGMDFISKFLPKRANIPTDIKYKLKLIKDKNEFEILLFLNVSDDIFLKGLKKTNAIYKKDISLPDEYEGDETMLKIFELQISSTIKKVEKDIRTKEGLSSFEIITHKAKRVVFKQDKEANLVKATFYIEGLYSL